MSGNYYTAFYFRPTKRIEVVNLHMTHKFLGVLSDEQAAEVRDVLAVYFGKFKALSAPTFKFNRIDFFGMSVVLLGQGLHGHLRGLREKLDAFAEDEFSYNPHITILNDQKAPMNGAVELPLALQPAGYSLMCGREEIRSWKIHARP